MSEPSFALQRYDGVFTSMPTVLDANANTASTIGISSFSDWTLFGELAPTSAPVTVAGRVIRTNGIGINNARLTAVDKEGNVLRTRTNGFGYFIFDFGYFIFDSVPSGQSYVVTVNHKQFTFAPQIVNVDDNIFDLTVQELE